MPVLDKFIQAMFDQSASQLRLQSGAPAAMEVSGTDKPVTREPLPKNKIMALVREIAPEGMRDHLDAESRMAFGYIADGKRVDVEILHAGDGVPVTIAPARPRRSSAAMSMPMEAKMGAGTGGNAMDQPPPPQTRVQAEA